MTNKAYFIARHSQMFRPNDAALITGVEIVNGRPCFHLWYPDGIEDNTPILDADFAGEGGLGVFYDIVGENAVTETEATSNRVDLRTYGERMKDLTGLDAFKTLDAGSGGYCDPPIVTIGPRREG